VNSTHSSPPEIETELNFEIRGKILDYCAKETESPNRYCVYLARTTTSVFTWVASGSSSPDALSMYTICMLPSSVTLVCSSLCRTFAMMVEMRTTNVNNNGRFGVG
jgi:hypothetical protein